MTQTVFYKKKRLSTLQSLSLSLASFLAFLFMLCATCPISANQEGDDAPFSFESSMEAPMEEAVELHFIAEDSSIQPGRPFWVAIRLQVKDHWHTYWKNPGDVGMPIQIDWNLPEGFQASQVEWPFPKRFTQNDIIGFGYDGEVILMARLTPPANLPTDKAVTIGADLRWLVCSESSCVPGDGDVRMELPVSTAAPQPNAASLPHFAKARATLPKKPWNVQARRKNQLIEVHLEAPQKAQGPYRYAYFCPENKTMVDSKGEAALSSISSKPGRYVLALKDHPNASANSLKGILVLESGVDPHFFLEALEIDIPIADFEGGETLASLFDAKIKPKSLPFNDNELALAEIPLVEIAPPLEFEGG